MAGSEFFFLNPKMDIFLVVAYKVMKEKKIKRDKLMHLLYVITLGLIG